MSDNVRKLKMNSRAIIMMSRWQPVFIAAFYTLIVMLLSNVVFQASGYYDVFNDYVAAFRAGNMAPDIVWPALEMTDLAIIIAAWLVLAVIEAGFNIAMLMLSRGKMARARDLLGGFSMPLKIIVVSVAKTVLTMLGYALFVAPGIMVGYMFRYAVEVLYDDPSVGAFGAMRRSAALTRGHKMEMFMLDISFIPWHLASGFVAYALSFSALDAWIAPYVQLAFSVHYNKLSGWQPSEDEDTSNNYVIWAKVNKDAASAPDMQSAAYPVQPEDAVQSAAAAGSEPVSPQAEPSPAEETVTTAAAPSYEKPAPDIEYWKTRAIQLQKEMQEKNK